MQAAGFYHNLDTRPPQAYRNFNTWMGDPIRALQAAKQIEVIRESNLVESSAKVGQKLYKSLRALGEGAGKGKMKNLRGKGEGTFIAWDMQSPKQRDTFLKEMRHVGVNMAGVSISASFAAEKKSELKLSVWRRSSQAPTNADFRYPPSRYSHGQGGDGHGQTLIRFLGHFWRPRGMGKSISTAMA